MGRIPVAPGIGLIFDMDGVIVDSMPVHEEAWELYLRRLGVAEASDIARRMHGRRNDDIVRDFLGPDSPESEVHFHGAEKERLYREMMAPQLEDRLVPGVTAFLAATSGAPVGLGTNAEPANVEFVLDRANLRAYFHEVADGTHAERPKPAPDIYLHVAERLGLDPRNCIVFEDSPVGTEAARAAGARVVGVLTHSSSLPHTDFEVSDFAAPELGIWLAQQRAY